MFTIYLCLVVLSLFADFRLHAGKADFSLDYPRSLFSNSLFSVSNDGNDTACENDLSTPCETISRACVLGASPRQVMVDTGIFKETQGVVVDAALIITGQSSSRCIITKVSDTYFTLFTVNNQFANLTLTNLVILLTDDGENCYFILASASDHIVMNECQITAHGSSDGKNTLSNVPFSVDSENTVFQINSCTIYNITTLNDAFIKVQHRNVNLSIAKSSFVNVGSNGNGGCFYSRGSSDVSLKECFFSECRCIAGGGIGYMDLVDGAGCTIQSCTFLNIYCAATTSGIGGGVLFMNARNERSLTITKTSFVNCKTLGGGGVLYLNFTIRASLSDCSFTLCAGRDGGAFCIKSSCVANISRCTFIKCTASEYGGAMYISSSSVIIADSVFVANSGYPGNDAFVGGTTFLEFVRTFTDKESASSAVECNSCANISQLHLKIDYDNATCDGSFSIQRPEECQMPCTEIDPDSEGNTSACVKPDDCPSEFAALAGSCVRTSVFSTPSDTPCVMDFSLGYPLCVPCAARKAHSDSVESLPCGSTFCFQQISNGGSGNGSLSTSCALTCDASHFEEDSNGRCRLLPCDARTAVSSLDYPCGTADCYQEISNGGSGYGSLSTSCALSCDTNHFEEDSNGRCRLLPCDARTAESSLDYPCGTTDCFQQVSNGGSGNGNLSTSCALTCDANHFEKDSNGRCRLLPCDARTAVSSLDYPCGTSDCFQQTNHKGTFINECRDTPSQSKGGGLSTGIIVLIVVGSVVGSVVAIVVIMLLVWKKRRQKAYLLPEWSLKPGVEIKDYLVHHREKFESQNAKIYVFVRGGENYTVKLVLSRNGICSGDLNWAVDFSAKVNSKFLVKYIETIIGNRGEFYIVMEHCEKGDFRALLKAIKNVREDAVLHNEAVMKIMIQLLLGLEVLHSNGVVHCDLGLGSIFFDEKGDAKIGNFGCTQCYKPSTEEGGKLLELENVDYVPAAFESPEYRAERNCTFSTDMFCLGFVFAEAFAFPKAVTGFNEEELKKLGMSDEILAIVNSLIGEDPDSRPSAAALLQDPYVFKYAEQFGFLKYYPSRPPTSE